MKAKTKIGIFLLLLVLVLGGGVYQAFEIQKEQAITQEQEQVNDTAGVVAGEVASDLSNAEALLSSSARQTNSVDDVDVQQLLTGPSNLGVHVVAANGTVVESRSRASLLTNASVGADVSDQRYVQEAMAEKTVISAPVWIPSRGKYAVIIAAPIVNENRSVEGVIARTRALDVNDSLGRESVRVYIDGTERSPPGVNGSQAGIPDAIYGSATVESQDWAITVRKDTTVLQDRMGELATLQVSGLLVVLVIVFGFAGWEYRMIIQQMDRLQDGFRALQDGEYDHSLELSGSDEWNRISEGYDHAKTELQARESAIRQREERLAVLNRALRHNLRNDMTGVIGRFEQLEVIGESSDVETIAEKGKTEAQEVTELGEMARAIESVLDSASDGLAQRDLARVMGTIVSEAEKKYTDTEFTTDLPPTAPVLAVPHLHPGLVEIVENACEHNDKNVPKVEISVMEGEPAADTTTLTVTDNGPGISTYERQVVGSGAETDLEHGSGLGLWLINWTVEKSNAEVDIETLEPDGTRVTVRFQRDRTDELPAERAPSAADQTASDGGTPD